METSAAWTETRFREEAGNQRKSKGFATIQLSTTEVHGERNTDIEKVIQEKHASLSQRRQCPEGNACDCLDPPVCSFLHQGNCTLGNKRAFKHTERAGSEPMKRTFAVVVAKTLDHTQAEDTVTSPTFIANGNFLHVSVVPVNSILQTSGGKLVNKFRLARLWQSDFVTEREKQGPILRILQQGGHSGRSPNALSFEQLGSSA